MVLVSRRKEIEHLRREILPWDKSAHVVAPTKWLVTELPGKGHSMPMACVMEVRMGLEAMHSALSRPTNGGGPILDLAQVTHAEALIRACSGYCDCVNPTEERTEIR